MSARKLGSQAAATSEATDDINFPEATQNAAQSPVRSVPDMVNATESPHHASVGLGGVQPAPAASGMGRTRKFLSKAFRVSRLHPRFFARDQLPELLELEDLISELSDRIHVEVLTKTVAAGREFPVYGLSMGNPDPQAPVLGFFGGVHGLERIGTHVVLAFLHTVSELILWDDQFNEKLERTRIILMPLINPGGMFLRWRANPNGVDLMRNAPVEAEDGTTFLISGHRYGPWLPWYRGGSVMEPEAQAVCDFVRRHIAQSRAAICVDVHSGFGAVDRLWFPYAKSIKPFPNLAEFFALNQLFDRSYPNHFYKIEPQALSYTTHGDLWDYLYDEHYREHGPNKKIFMPLCLEMGSWSWVRKNPWQIFSALGPFNPIKVHRHQRILRRHYTLFDFLQRAVYSHPAWAHLEPAEKSRFEHEARVKWYSR